MSTNTDLHELSGAAAQLSGAAAGLSGAATGWPDAAALEQLANQFFQTAPGVDPIEGLLSLPLPQAGGPGSGLSPLAVERPQAFDIKDPQSSLPDPHFSDGKVPVSVAGSGRLISPEMDKAPSKAPSAAHAESFPANAQQAVYYFLKEANPWRHEKESREKESREKEGNWEREGSPFARLFTAGVNGHTGLMAPPFDVAAIRKDFPILGEIVNGRPLIWLDNAATTQKPRQVIDRISHFYSHENSNIHRAAHELAARATDAYEGARKKVQEFLNAGSANEIVFVRGATEAINLVAKSWGEQYLNSGDEVIVSHLEHHANIVPWQQLAEKKGVKLKVIPVDADGQLLLDEYSKLLTNKTKLVAITQVSNALGTITPVKQIAAMAHAAGARVLVDGAQSVSHMPVDVRDIGADWFVFSGHKVFAPTGIGVLYGKEALLNETQPWQGGGNMIKDVTFEHTQYHNAPGRFEAGTGNIADAVGLGAAIDYVTRIGMERIDQYEHYLLAYATRLLKEVPGLRLIGTAEQKASVLSFVLDGFTNDQVGQALNKEGIAVRTGHHCAQPILRRFGLESTVRPSLAFYNTCADVDALVTVLHRLRSHTRH